MEIIRSIFMAIRSRSCLLVQADFHTNSNGLNTTNPMRRDTVIIPSYGHAVLRIDTSNPGVWAFHCHIVSTISTVTGGEDGIVLMPRVVADVAHGDWPVDDGGGSARPDCGLQYPGRPS